jgi:hypothetical protein
LDSAKRRAAVFGARKLQSDDPSERTDERVVEVVVTADGGWRRGTVVPLKAQGWRHF